MTSAGWCEQARAGAEGVLVACGKGRHSVECARVEGTLAPFACLELGALRPELGEAQASSSPLVLAGRAGATPRREEKAGESGKRREKKKKKREKK